MDWIAKVTCTLGVFVPAFVWLVAGEIGIRRWKRQLVEAAREFGGLPGRGERVECEFGGHRAIIAAPWGRYSSSPPTRIDVEAPFRAVASLRTRGLMGRMFRLLLRPAFETGNEELDRLCDIRVTGEAIGRRLANRSVADALGRLALLGLQLDIRQAGATFRFQRVERSVPEFRAMLRLVDAIVQGLVDPAGVEIGELIIRAGRCPTCGEEAGDAVRCGKCGTPQHADCWEYLGCCAMFACGGRRMRRP